MLKQNKQIHEVTGVAKFHAAGYTGSRVKAATGEELVPSDWPGPGRTESLINKGETSNNFHCTMTAGVFFEVAPDAILYRASNSIKRNSDGTFTYDLYDVLMPKMEQLGINLMFNSLSVSGTPGDYFKKRVEKFLSQNDYFVAFWAAGNDGTSGCNGNIYIPGTFGVAAYCIENGKIVPKPYSSESSEVDFSAPTDVWYKTNTMNNPITGSGTSTATPYLCGMAALVQDFFIDKTGKPLKRTALYRFFMDHCVDLKDPGKDNKTGYGAVVLPDPSTINIWAYQEMEGEKMQVDDFNDAAQISSWAKDSVQKCLDSGIMDGVGNGMFDPKGAVTCEQIATIAARLIKFLS